MALYPFNAGIFTRRNYMKQYFNRLLRRNLTTGVIFSLFIFISILAFNTSGQAQQAKGNYENEVKGADEAFNAKDYGTSLMRYRSASNLQPAQKYPQEQINTISKLLNENTNLKNNLFEDAILKGESFLSAKNYPAANLEFSKALEIDPTAQYPKDKLAAIRKVYNDPGEAARYSDAMSKATQAMAAGDYDLAKNWYQVALTSNPDAREPRDKMLEADKLKAEGIAKKSQYDKIIAGADKLLEAGKRPEAKAEYQKALDLLPNQVYSKQKLAEINSWIADRQKEQDAYDHAISQADQFYINRDFANARIKYEEALKVKPTARYPK
ncbi:MAG TPA: hypothetical protein PLP88_03950, partial [Bacteroidales bacterium]|nr:hypothetical protein [Bacteroidales bacterium]